MEGAASSPMICGPFAGEGRERERERERERGREGEGEREREEERVICIESTDFSTISGKKNEVLNSKQQNLLCLYLGSWMSAKRFAC